MSRFTVDIGTLPLNTIFILPYRDVHCRRAFQLNWNRKLLDDISCVLFEIVGVIVRLSLCLLMPAEL